MGVAIAAKRWTLRELHSLPDDGNKYEVIHGALFVTPAPEVVHEETIARLFRIIDPYVAAQGLGLVLTGHSVVQFQGSEAGPDLIVRRPHPGPRKVWKTAPTPILVVEVHSPSTRRRDLKEKREYYFEIGVPEYWMIDPDERTVRVARAGHADVLVSGRLTWAPPGTWTPLEFDVRDLFG